MNAFNTDLKLFDPEKKVDYTAFYTPANVAKAQKWNLKSECDSYHLLANNGLYKKGMTFNETFESIFACYKEAYLRLGKVLDDKIEAKMRNEAYHNAIVCLWYNDGCRVCVIDNDDVEAFSTLGEETLGKLTVALDKDTAETQVQFLSDTIGYVRTSMLLLLGRISIIYTAQDLFNTDGDVYISQTNAVIKDADGNNIDYVFPLAEDDTLFNSTPSGLAIMKLIMFTANNLLNNPPIEVVVKRDNFKSKLSPSQKKKWGVEEFDKYKINGIKLHLKRLREEEEKATAAKAQKEAEEKAEAERRALLVWIDAHDRCGHYRHYKSGKIIQVKGSRVKAHHRGDLNDPVSITPRKIKFKV